MTEMKQKDNRQAVYKHYHDGVLFYIGCGNMSYGRPYQTISRNNGWWEFCKGQFDVEIVKYFDLVDKSDAEKLEAELIMEELEKGTPLVNIGIGKSYRGKNNGMYGKGHLLKGRVRTSEHSRNIGIANKGRFAGENNPMYGISMIERMNGDLDRYEKWKNNVGKATRGGNNGNASSVYVADLNLKKIKTFLSLKEASEHTKIPASTISSYTLKYEIFERNGFALSRNEEVLNDLF